MQRLLIILLALASVGTTLLVAMSAAKRSGGGDHTTLRGGTTPINADHPPVLVQLPEFTLTERRDEPFGSADLAGQPWIAMFIFTRCAGPCPAMTSRMAEMQFKLRDTPLWERFRLVTITVDPAHDTPAVLKERARIAHADPERWVWLTGSREEIWSLIRDGFKLPVADNPDNLDEPILHSQRFVLIDGLGRVRGYYDALDDRGFDAVVTDMTRVMHE